jgi:Copper binding proteins, plastocyanin/azurin family
MVAELASALALSLVGTVGTNDGFDIGLTDTTGLAAGTYTLVVHDRSAFHNFHLIGPGVDIATGIDFTGDQEFTVTLVDGIYVFQCDPHATQGMKGQFTVGNATPPTPAPVRRATASIVGSRASLAGLAVGKVTLTVNDRSKTDGFLLRGPGVSKRTGVAFTGKATWTLTLQPGTYTWGSVGKPKLRHRIALS